MRTRRLPLPLPLTLALLAAGCGSDAGSLGDSVPPPAGEATPDAPITVTPGAKADGLRSLLGDEHAGLAQRIDQGYAELNRQLVALDQPFATLLADSTGREQLNALYQQLDQVHRLHQSELARALGIQIGFNAHDGD